MKPLLITLFCLMLPRVSVAQSSTQHLLSLAATEKAFAAATVYLGVRSGFLTFFGDNALSFGDSVGLYKVGLKKRPWTVFPLTTVLEWTPFEGDVARSGDMGYLTGPSQFRPAEPGSQPTYSGWYFSVWKRQEDGTWKVYIDLGTESPLSKVDMAAIEFRPAESFTDAPDTTSTGSLDHLSQTEKRLNDEMMKAGGTVGPFLSKAVRFHRNGVNPVVGRTDVQKLLDSAKTQGLSHVAGEISKAGDLAFTHGTYNSKNQKGHYVRIWKWLSEKRWSLLVDVTSQIQ